MNALRQLRRNANVSQQQCAELLGVPVNTFRMWDSGRRPIPCGVIERVTVSLTEHVRDTEPLSLDQLASELCVHERTLRAAARSGRLVVHLSSQSAFGRPIQRAARQAARAFMEHYYRKSYSRFAIKPPAPNVVVPSDYARRLRCLRRQLSMMQTQLAMTIGAQVKQSSISGSLEIERPRQYSGEGLNNCVAERYWARKYGLSFLRRLSNRSNFQRTTWRIA